MSILKYCRNFARLAGICALALCAACSDKARSPSDQADGAHPPGPGPAASTPVQSGPRSAVNNYVGLSSLGMPFSALLGRFSYDATQEADGYLWVLKNGKALFGLSDKNDLQDKTVWMIEIVSPDITTDGGVHVGMTIKELLDKYPDLALDVGEEEQEMFAPDALQHGTPANPDARVFIYVQSNDGGRLSSVDLSKFPTKDFSREGVVSRILVYVTGNRSPKGPTPAPRRD